MISATELYLDVTKDGQQGKVHVRKGDANSRKLIIHIHDGGDHIDFNGHNIQIYALKPDGEKIYNDCEIIDDVVEVTLTSQMCAVSGVVQAELQILNNDGVLYAPKFVIAVENTVFDDDAIESSSEFTELIRALRRINNAEVTSNKTGIIDSESTDEQYPTAKSVYNALRVIGEIVDELDNAKVDKESGKSLSSNDYTDAEKQIVSSLNLAMPDVMQNIALLQAYKVDKVDGKGLSSNDFTDDDKQSINTAITEISNVIGALNSKVDKVVGKGLSTNDYTDKDKEKLYGIEPTDLTPYRTSAEQDVIDETKMPKMDDTSTGMVLISDGQGGAMPSSIADMDIVTQDNLSSYRTADEQDLIDASKVGDVKVNGTSIVTDGIANVPVANRTTPGVIKANYVYGLSVNSSGFIVPYFNNSQLSNRATEANSPSIVGSNNLDYAVKCAMTDGKGAEWTEQEQNNACDRIGTKHKDDIPSVTVGQNAPTNPNEGDVWVKSYVGEFYRNDDNWTYWTMNIANQSSKIEDDNRIILKLEGEIPGAPATSMDIPAEGRTEPLDFKVVYKGRFDIYSPSIPQTAYPYVSDWTEVTISLKPINDLYSVYFCIGSNLDTTYIREVSASIKADDGLYVYNNGWISALDSVYDKSQVDSKVDVYGTTNGWDWVKHPNGIAECWKTVQVRLTLNVAWGNMFFGQYVPQQTYPFTFKERPFESVSINSDNNAGMLMCSSGDNGGLNTTTKSAKYNVCRPTSASAYTTFHFRYYVRGKI